MVCYVPVVSTLIREYEKTINNEKNLEQTAKRKSLRLTHKDNLDPLNPRLDCLKIISGFLAREITDYNLVKSKLDILQDIIDVEEGLQEYYNASALECLMEDIKYVF